MGKNEQILAKNCGFSPFFAFERRVLGQNATNFCQDGSFNNILIDFLCILPIVFVLKCDIIDLSSDGGKTNE